MQPHELEAHRLQISVTVETVLTGYWQDNLPPSLRAAVLADWCDELQDWRPEQVQAALRMWRRDNPDKRPNPGHISRLLKAERGKAVVARMQAQARAPQPEPPRVSKERAAELMAQVGFVAKRMGGEE